MGEILRMVKSLNSRINTAEKSMGMSAKPFSEGRCQAQQTDQWGPGFEQCQSSWYPGIGEPAYFCAAQQSGYRGANEYYQGRESPGAMADPHSYPWSNRDCTDNRPLGNVYTQQTRPPSYSTVARVPSGGGAPLRLMGPKPHLLGWHAAPGPWAGNSGFGPSGERLCFRCGNPNHLVRSCPVNLN